MRREAGGNAGRERPGAGAGRGAAGSRRKGEKHEATLRMHGLGTQGGPGGQPARYVPRAGGAGLLAAHAVACEGPPPQEAPGAREAAAQGHFGRGKAADSGLPPDARFAGGVRAGAGPGVSGACGSGKGAGARRAARRRGVRERRTQAGNGPERSGLTVRRGKGAWAGRPWTSEKKPRRARRGPRAAGDAARPGDAGRVPRLFCQLRPRMAPAMPPPATPMARSLR